MKRQDPPHFYSDYKEPEAAPSSLNEQYEAILTKLVNLGYENQGSYPTPVRRQSEVRNFTRYHRRTDGSQVVVYRLYRGDKLEHYEVYKEVSLSANATEYREAIT